MGRLSTTECTYLPTSCKVSHKNHLFYPIVFESLYLSLLCLFAALLSYTGFQNYSLI